MPSFASITELQNHLQRTFAVGRETDAATQALELATGLIQHYTGQQLFPGTSTETFPAPLNFTVLGGVVVLRQRPVTTVTSVTIDGEAADFTVDGAAGIVWIKRTVPLAETTRHPEISVTYNHGFNPIPAELKAVCLEVARQVVDNPKGFVQMSVGDVSGSYGSVSAGVGLALSARHEQMLASLRR